MTPCARGCCYTGGLGVCFHRRLCACHSLNAPRNEPRSSNARSYRNPTQDEAIRRVTAAKRGRKKK